MALGSEVGLGPGHVVLDGTHLPSPKRAQPPVFGLCLLWPNGRPSQLLLSTCNILWLVHCALSIVKQHNFCMSDDIHVFQIQNGFTSSAPYINTL